MKRYIKLILLFGALLLILLFIYVTRPIKVGVLYSLDSSVGSEQNYVLQFYNQNNPRVGLRRVKLIYENPPLNEEEIISSYRRLEEQGVVAIVGAALSFEAVILAPLAEESGIPFLSPTASTSKLSKKRDNFYQFINDTASQGRNAGRYLSSLGSKKTALILSDSNRAFSESLGDAFISSYIGESIKIFNNPEKPAYMELKEFNPDFVFFIVPSGELIEYINFLREELPETRITTSSWGYQQLLQVFSGPQIDGIIVVTITDEEMVEPSLSKSREFERVYKLKPTYIFGFAYSACEELYRALRDSGTSREDVIRYFDTPRFYNAPYGKYYMTEFGDTVAEYYYIFEIAGSDLDLITKFPIEEYPNEE